MVVRGIKSSSSTYCAAVLISIIKSQAMLASKLLNVNQGFFCLLLVTSAHRQIVAPGAPFARALVEMGACDFVRDVISLVEKLAHLLARAPGQMPFDLRLFGFDEHAERSSAAGSAS
jgi:hypothetical protein